MIQSSLNLSYGRWNNILLRFDNLKNDWNRPKLGPTKGNGLTHDLSRIRREWYHKRSRTNGFRILFWPLYFEEKFRSINMAAFDSASTRVLPFVRDMENSIREYRRVNDFFNEITHEDPFSSSRVLRPDASFGASSAIFRRSISVFPVVSRTRERHV